VRLRPVAIAIISRFCQPLSSSLAAQSRRTKAKRLEFDSLVHFDSAVTSLSFVLGTEASGFDPDGPLPTDLLDTNASKTGRAGVLKFPEDEKLTVRQLTQRYGGLAFVGPPEKIADEFSV
jgi:hypothetical protein